MARNQLSVDAVDPNTGKPYFQTPEQRQAASDIAQALKPLSRKKRARVIRKVVQKLDSPLGLDRVTDEELKAADRAMEANLASVAKLGFNEGRKQVREVMTAVAHGDGGALAKAISGSAALVTDPSCLSEHDRRLTRDRINRLARTGNIIGEAVGNTGILGAAGLYTETSKWDFLADAFKKARASPHVGGNRKADIEARIVNNSQAYNALRELREWVDGQCYVLQKPEGSAWHKLIQAGHEQKVYGWDQGEKKTFSFWGKVDVVAQAQVFVVEHDWAKAFDKATDFHGGEFNMPFEGCVFEFRISGRRVCAATGPLSPTGQMTVFLFVGLKDGSWFTFGPYTPEAMEPDHPDNKPWGLVGLVWGNIRAVCIALDAEVAVSDVKEAPRKLNAARAKKGLLPLKDYHVVSLTRRLRGERAPREPGAEPTHRKRLHFRRGHHRTYIDGVEHPCTEHVWQNRADVDRSGRQYCGACAVYRRWIKWMLVGNPDLGFIDKHYRL